MLSATTRLRLAASQAVLDIQQLPSLKEHSSHAQRLKAALKLLQSLDSSNIKESKYGVGFCAHLSAVQLILAGLDACLESLAPPRNDRLAN